MKNNRIQVYLSEKEFNYCLKNAEKMGLSCSGYLRYILYLNKQDDDCKQILNNDPYFLY